MRRRTASAGFSLLEQAIVLPAILLFTVGVIDISRIMQARGAMQEAVEASLRCLYPVDGDCVLPQRAGSAALYDVERARPGEELWPLPWFEYSGEAGELVAPQIALSEPYADILGSVSYSRRVPAARIVRVLHPSAVDAHFYLKTSSLPYVVNGEDTNSALSPQFRYLERRGLTFPPAEVDFEYHLPGGRRVDSISEISETTTSGGGIVAGYISFVIPPLEKDIPCYVSSSIDDPTAVQLPSFVQTCRKETTRITFHIAGTSGCENGAEGAVDLAILNQNRRSATGWISLGGRQLSYSAPGNFYARGALHYDDDLKQSEFTKYADIQVKRGVKVWLRFLVRSDNGRKVGWTAQNIRVYVPEHREVVLNGLRCQGSDISEIEACRANYANQQVPYAALENLRIMRGEASGTVAHSQCKAAADLVLPDNSGDWRLEKCQDLLRPETSSCCSPLADRGCRNVDFPSDASCGSRSARDCGLSKDDVKEVAGLTCSPRRLAIELLPEGTGKVADGALLYARDRCDKPEMPPADYLPDYLKIFPKLRWGKIAPAPRKAIQTGKLHPDEFVEEHSEYACGFIRPRFYDVAQVVPAERLAQSLFAGRHPLICDWQKRLAEELADYAFPGDAYVKFDRRLAGESLEKQRPAAACYDKAPRFQEGTFERVSGGPFKESDLPAACFNGAWICRLTRLSDTAAPVRPEFDLDLARQKGYSAFSAVAPWVRLGCGDQGGNCLEMSIEKREETKAFNVKATVSMKTYFRRAVVLKHAGGEVFEGEYAR